jgi:hypothetical protein
MRTILQRSGTKLWAEHIEKPAREFVVSFDHPGFWKVLWHESDRLWIRAMAETAEGAILVAQYHYFRGANFRIEEGEANAA